MMARDIAASCATAWLRACGQLGAEAFAEAGAGGRAVLEALLLLAEGASVCGRVALC